MMSVVRASIASGLSLGQVGGRLSVLRQGAGNVVLNGTALVVNFLTTLILSHLLGADGYGAYAFALSLTVLLSVPAVLGIPPLLVREITSYRLSESWGAVRGIVRRANELVLLSSVTVCVVAAAVFVATGWPHGPFHRPSLLALPLIPMIAVTSARQGVMQGFGRVVLGRSPETAIMPAVFLVTAGVLGLALGDRFTADWAVVISDGAGLVAVVVGIVFLRRVLPAQVRSAPPEYESPRWIRAAGPLIAFSLVSTASSQLPTVLLGALSDSAQVGIYNVAFRLAGLLSFLLIAATPALMPAIAELNVLERHDELQRLMTRSARMILLASLPLGLVALVFAGPLLRIFGADFEGGETALRILVVGQLVNVATGIPGTALIMLGEASAMTATFAMTTVLTLALSAALVPTYGANGAAIATASGVVASNLILAGLLWRRRRIYAPALLGRLWVR